jgi:hypothetical protein
MKLLARFTKKISLSCHLLATAQRMEQSWAAAQVLGEINSNHGSAKVARLVAGDGDGDGTFSPAKKGPFRPVSSLPSFAIFVLNATPRGLRSYSAFLYRHFMELFPEPEGSLIAMTNVLFQQAARPSILLFSSFAHHRDYCRSIHRAPSQRHNRCALSNVSSSHSLLCHSRRNPYIRPAEVKHASR